MAPANPEVTERESMKVAEASRQQEWAQPSFMRELFLGNFRLDLVHPYPLPGAERLVARGRGLRVGHVLRVPTARLRQSGSGGGRSTEPGGT